ncbi:hypothetical protein GCM10010441_54180 [Kitasatospora paracochleata]|uniref:Uncharacterized protein n=1 Tax=Kitasatospora paracochleata TaxID=58354 RepID=A0ABT1IV50_9ACTN|nr:hypothetical protein [Kitasatospora paracochleata]MCP2309008.1 hypothetical protein [Kitasatospora paracochleata]
MSVALPPGLAGWAEQLGALSPQLGIALGPLVRRIEALVADREPQTAPEGELDGFGGLTRAGSPERLPASEWLLAQEFPDEFVRRAADRELLQFAPEFRATRPRGRVVVLVDAGPAQAGAARLVQLAALVVLHRRAAARGTDLAVGVLGDPPGEYLDGDLPRLLPGWLRARRHRDAEVADVQEAEAALDAPDEAWLLTSPALAEQLPTRRRVLAAAPSRWAADGVTHVRLALSGGTAELPLPERRIAVRALRGEEFRTGRRPPAPLPELPAGRLMPTFTGPAAVLLARPPGSDKLLVSKLPTAAHPRQLLRPTKHGFPGPVVAAARIGRRLIVLTAEKGCLTTRVVGRPLGGVGLRRPVPFAELGVDRELLADLLERPVLPVELDVNDVLVPLAGRWWALTPNGGFKALGELGPRGSTLLGGPPFRWAWEGYVRSGFLPPDADEYVMSRAAVAWRAGADHWCVRLREAPPGTPPQVIPVPQGVEVVGVAGEGQLSVLVTVEPGERVVRSVWSSGSRTLDRFSGGALAPFVHWEQPLIVAEPQPGRLVVGNPVTGWIRATTGDPR